MNVRLFIIYLSIIALFTPVAKGESTPVDLSDQVAVQPVHVDTISSKPFYKRGIIGKLMDYISDSGTSRSDKNFNFTVLAGPHYSSDYGFGIGLGAGCTYRTNPADTITQPSYVSLYGDATTGLYFKLGIRGVNIMAQDRRRLDYDLYFESFDTYYWGIGYEMNKNNANKTDFKYLKATLRASMLWRVLPNFFIGPEGAAEFVRGRKAHDKPIWGGQPTHTFNTGVALRLMYDSRDNVACAHRGEYLSLTQRFSPSWLGNKCHFNLTDIDMRIYRPVWKGGIIAAQLHTRLSYGNTPWGLLPKLGGPESMRGYYDGRYRDKCMAETTLELRQHLFWHIGMVTWAGAGSVFPKISKLSIKRVLPDFGAGARWEIRKNFVVRLDYGIGRGESAVIFSVDEAF